MIRSESLHSTRTKKEKPRRQNVSMTLNYGVKKCIWLQIFLEFWCQITQELKIEATLKSQLVEIISDAAFFSKTVLYQNFKFG